MFTDALGKEHLSKSFKDDVSDWAKAAHSDGGYMKDGRLIVQFEEGRVTGVSVDAALEHTYAELFADARTHLQKDSNDLQAAIRLVIFGCFWLEATCNNHLQAMLQGKLEARLAEALWTTLDRRSVPEKLNIIAAFATEDAAGESGAVLSRAKVAFSLRNKLAHYKSAPSAISDGLTTEQVGALLKKHEEIPEAELIRGLREPAISTIAEHIQAAADWLNEVFTRRSHMVNATTPLVSQMVSSSQEFVEAGH